jgi:hypothetical protein
MKNLCIDLDFKFPLLKNENLKEKYKEQRHKLIDTTDLNEDFCELIKIKNLRFAHSQVFYLTPFSFMEVHQDENFLEDFPKMNFVFGGKDSVMQWFNPRPDSVKKLKSTPLGKSYVSYNIADVKLIYRHTIAQPSIVQAGVPHNVVNFSEPRQCFSFVFNKKDHSPATFNELATLFQEYKT